MNYSFIFVFAFKKLMFAGPVLSIVAWLMGKAEGRKYFQGTQYHEVSYNGEMPDTEI